MEENERELSRIASEGKKLLLSSYDSVDNLSKSNNLNQNSPEAELFESDDDEKHEEQQQSRRKSGRHTSINLALASQLPPRNPIDQRFVVPLSYSPYFELYAIHYDEEDAKKCLEEMKDRYFEGKRLYPEYSSVTDFEEARCRQFDSKNCARGLKCNFAHIKLLPNHKEFLKNLIKRQTHAGTRSRELELSLRRTSRKRSRDRR